jgi:hypothetical protein
MGEWLKKRQVKAGRDRPGAGGPMPETQDAGSTRPTDIVRTLQQGAGNAAVASLMGAQRAPTRPGDELMDPNADATPAPSGTSADDAAIIAQIVGTDSATPGNGTAPATAAPTPATTGAGAATAAAGTAAADKTTGEQALFDRTILDPILSIYAVLRDEPPDFELAEQKFNEIGMAMLEYQTRFETSNPQLWYMMMAIRGWIGRPLREIHRRIGSDKPMSDRGIAEAVGEVIPDLNAFRAKLP